MPLQNQSQLDVTLARVCEGCPACRRARKQQRGLALWWVRKVETRMCPFCRAYARVQGRLAHQGVVPKQTD